MNRRVVMAIGAHPDDIEFMMAGTLRLLQQAGYAAHYMNLSTGSCGSQVYPPARLRVVRRREAQAAARLLGATWHASLVDDMEIYYADPTLRRLTAVLREVGPSILLVPSPQDYMEDHTNACRLAVSAATEASDRIAWPAAQPVFQPEKPADHRMPAFDIDGILVPHEI